MTKSIQNDLETVLQNLATTGADEESQITALYGFMVQLQGSYKKRTGTEFSLATVFDDVSGYKSAFGLSLIPNDPEAGYAGLKRVVTFAEDHDFTGKQKVMLNVADLSLSLVDQFSAKAAKDLCAPVVSDARAGQAVKFAENLGMNGIASLLKHGLAP